MIYIIQVLCPNRHAIFAIVYDEKDKSHVAAMDEIQKQIKDWIANKTINPWCGICQSRDWTYEQRRTKYKTMDEAKVEMKKLEMENLLTRMLIDGDKAAKN